MSVSPTGDVRTTYVDVAGHFDRMAAQYDDGCVKVGWRGHEVVFEALRQYLSLAVRPLRVLDLGAGTGLIGGLFKSVNPKTHVTGVDISAKMLDVAQQLGRVDRAIVGDVTHLPECLNDHYDVVTSSGVLDFIPDTENFAAEVARVLRPTGVFAITYEPVGTVESGHKTLQHETIKLREQFARHGARVYDAGAINGIYTNFKTGLPVRNDLMIGTLDYMLQ
jgi:ubiquinone/menaquinone biosynthesis C-methylase UbiE